jgi:hypothetical protein
MKLQKRHEDLLCSCKELMDSYALLESAHGVMVTMVKDSQPHTCTCAQPSIDLLVLTLIAPKQSHHVMSMYM